MVHGARQTTDIGMEKVVALLGVSLRTFQCHKKAGAKERLNREQSGRLYKAAEILAKAIDVLGSAKAEERFLEEPAIARPAAPYRPAFDACRC